ncbi:A/G-specific DNA-adenine glycosylase [Chryseolinea serpens]|uniref:Adenine DNA glycosylase n=1 Tax=Chryseolinea serpens TaxID=947013 RepID=A0A1M5XGX2_9BACT|nr:A/G-specific adenine glycosylase [Chryseolinea serpens]SHH99009.1 A/G-specific DNA-adenine glycosylase [Chryseolinea serpens]
MDKRYFSDKVVKWYEENKRDLPWRDTKDPYKVWLSEIILQQTRVIQGLPYYLKFVEKFPTVQALAAASEQEVLRLWQGLGYYTRARNLHACAKEVVSRYQGVFPQTFEELKKLRGVGDYTAAAIASFSFQEPVAVVDGNVFRVLSRVFGIDKEINSPEGRKMFTQLANELISRKHPDRYNQAVMEFGALFCTPKNPDCPSCTFKATCFAAQHDMQAVLPVKAKAKAARKRYFYYFVFQQGRSLLMKKREAKDIWHGLYDFYLVEKSKPMKTERLIQEFNTSGPWVVEEDGEASEQYKHVLSHQIILSKFILVRLDAKPVNGLTKDMKFYSLKKIADLPKPVLISRFLADRDLLK